MRHLIIGYRTPSDVELQRPSVQIICDDQDAYALLDFLHARGRMYRAELHETSLLTTVLSSPPISVDKSKK